MSEEEEVVNPIPVLREGCRKDCSKQQQLYDACVQRISASKQGDCESWFFDLVSCVDKCVAPKVFKLTKE